MDRRVGVADLDLDPVNRLDPHRLDLISSH